MQHESSRCLTLLRVVASSLVAAAGASVSASASAEEPFAIRVVDDDTGRGVPLVELKTTTNAVYVTDSNGYVAIDDPALLGERVFFHVASHGYEFPADGFGSRGKALAVEPGGEATLSIKRVNIAERLYRITGAGIYRDSVMLGKDVPLEKPLLAGQVTGQDSVQGVVKGDRVWWFWGDTGRLSYPLGNFNTSGAVSQLPHAGGLDPAEGIDLEYFVREDGFSRAMFKPEPGVLIWIDGTFALEDPEGKQRILTHYSRRKSLAEEISSGLSVLNEETNVFEPVRDYTEEDKLHPIGHAFRVEVDGREYVYFAAPYALVRVPAEWEVVLESDRWEAYTPLVAGSAWDAERPNLDRTDDGRLHYAWKRNTAVVDFLKHQELIDNGHIEPHESHLRTVDAETKRPILLQAGTIRWNKFRERYVLIAHERGGGPSFLGEVWYAESRRPEGPFEQAVRIVTHDDYSFYNVAHHDFFDQEGGRTIYFEGTYTAQFTDDARPTPWYDYNQIMYRLDLADPRLEPAAVSQK
jgi:hypothetical protein